MKRANNNRILILRPPRLSPGPFPRTKLDLERTSRWTRPVTAISVALLFGLFLLVGFWVTARPPESDAILDLSQEVVVEMWEASSSGPRLTNFFRFTDTRGRLFECQEVGYAAQEGIQ